MNIVEKHIHWTILYKCFWNVLYIVQVLHLYWGVTACINFTLTAESQKCRLLTFSTWSLPWSRGSKAKPRKKRATVCGTSGSARQRFSSAPVKFDWHPDQILTFPNSHRNNFFWQPLVKNPALLEQGYGEFVLDCKRTLITIAWNKDEYTKFKVYIMWYWYL